MNVGNWIACAAVLLSTGGCAEVVGATVPATACYASNPDHCTATDWKYDPTTETFAPVEHHFGCGAWSGESCEIWVDADDPANRSKLEAAHRLRDLQDQADSLPDGWGMPPYAREPSDLWRAPSDGLQNTP
jgi:hypothetical protein